MTFETERLKALLIKVIKRLAKYEPDALDLLDEIHMSDPDDDLSDALGAEDVTSVKSSPKLSTGEDATGAEIGEALGVLGMKASSRRGAR